MLNSYGEEGESVDRLRFQLGAIIAQTEEQLKEFYLLYDQYVSDNTFIASQRAEKKSSSIKRKALLPQFRSWHRWDPVLPIVLLLMLLGAFGRGVYLWLIPPCSLCEVHPIIRIEGTGESRKFQADIQRKLHWPDRLNVDSVVWDLGDGKKKRGLSFPYRYTSPGDYTVKLSVFDASGCSIDNIPISIKVSPTTYLRSSVVPSGKGNEWNFLDQSVLFRPEPWDTLSSDTLIEEPTYTWNFGDGSPLGRGRQVSHTFPSMDTFQVQRFFEGRWGEITIRDTQFVQAYTLPQPSLPKFTLIDSSIEDLLPTQTEEPTLWYLWPLGLLLLYLLLELYLAWRRKVAIDDSQKRGPPLRQALELDPLHMDFFHTREFADLVRLLRRRRRGTATQEPDVEASVQQTAQAGGLPSLHFSQESIASQYLILIEQKTSRDSLAQLFAYICQEFASRDLSVECYFFREEPQTCFRRSPSETISLGKLASLYPNYRLGIIGEGDALLDKEAPRLESWVSQFESWTERAWLSSRPTEAWGQTEHLLSEYFVLVPSTSQGLAALPDLWNAEDRLNIQDWRRKQFELDFLIPQKRERVIPELQNYLGETGLHILAACAWYPELHAELSIQLGEKIQFASEISHQQHLDFWIHLFRLPWFRAGQIPRWLREALVDALPEEKARKARGHILELLKETRNRPPSGSFAEADRQVQQAMLTFLNSNKKRKARKALKNDLQDPSVDLQAQISFREITQIRPNPLTLLVPARFFYNSVPMLGLQQRYRLRIALVLLPLLLGLTWYLWERKKTPIIYDPIKVYNMSDLEINTAYDSAIYYNHEGYLLYQADSNNAQVKERFERAYQLASAFDTADINSNRVAYNRGVDYYRQGNYAQSLRNIGLVSDGDLSNKTRMLAVYALGLDYLEIGYADSAALMFDPLFCGVEDSLLTSFRDSLAQNPSFANLYRYRMQQDTGLARVWDCLFPPTEGRILATLLNVRSSPRSDIANILFQIAQGERYPVLDAYFPNSGGSTVKTRRKALLYPYESFPTQPYLELPEGTLLRSENQTGVPEGYHHVSWLSDNEGPGAQRVNGYMNSLALTKPRFVTWYKLNTPKGEGWVDSSFVELLNVVDREPPYRPVKLIEAVRGSQSNLPIPSPSKLVLLRYTGMVQDSSENPLKDVSISWGGGQVVYSDSMGLFSLIDSSGISPLRLDFSKEGYQARSTQFSWENRETGGTFIHDNLTPEILYPSTNLGIIPPQGMVLVPGGSFQMGSPASDPDRDDDEGPVHPVSIDSFFLDAREVTVAEFARFVDADGLCYRCRE